MVCIAAWMFWETYLSAESNLSSMWLFETSDFSLQTVLQPSLFRFALLCSWLSESSSCCRSLWIPCQEFFHFSTVNSTVPNSVCRTRRFKDNRGHILVVKIGSTATADRVAENLEILSRTFYGILPMGSTISIKKYMVIIINLIRIRVVQNKCLREMISKFLCHPICSIFDW